MGGKVDWMAANLPVEGDRGPYVGGSLIDVATCRVDEAAAEVAPRTSEGNVVVVDGSRRALGTVDAEALRDAHPGATVADIMEIMPDTIRPSVLLADLDERAAGMLVTTPEGVLLGAVDPATLG